MAENKKSFLLYADIISVVKKLVLKDRESKTNTAGELFLHLLEYVNDTNPVPIDFIVEMAFEPIKLQLKRDLEKWDDELIKKSESGVIGNLKRWNPDLYEQVIEKKISLHDACLSVKERKVAHHRTPIVPDATQSHPIANIAVTVTGTVTDINTNTIKAVSDKSETKLILDARALQFKKTLTPFVPKYGIEMLKEFYDYWIEPNKSKTKMRFEMEKAWELSRRLATWAKRNSDFTKEPQAQTLPKLNYENGND